jgi:hypothetical protein
MGEYGCPRVSVMMWIENVCHKFHINGDSKARVVLNAIAAALL